MCRSRPRWRSSRSSSWAFTCRAPGRSALSRPCSGGGGVVMESKGLRIALRVWVALVLLFLFIPIALIVLYAFNKSNIESWPIPGVTTHWFSVAAHDSQVRAALWLSVRVGLAATALALVLGGMVSFALHQFRFFGRDAISL